MKKWYFTQEVEFNVEAETKEEALAIIRGSNGFEGLKPLHRVGYINEVLPYDEEGNLMVSGLDSNLKTIYYVPKCMYGYKDCVCDPALSSKKGKYDFDADRWCLENCEDGSMYDDECK